MYEEMKEKGSNCYTSECMYKIAEFLGKIMKKGIYNMGIKIEYRDKSRWEKLAGVFKLRLFEKFALDIDDEHDFYFRMYGLAKVGSDGIPQPADEELKMMLDGEAKITLPKFAPRNDEDYWYWDDCSVIRSKRWEDTFTDKQKLMVGNCFRTSDDAREGWEKLYDFVNTYHEKLMQDTFYKKKE